MEVDDDGADERADELGDQVHRDHVPRRNAPWTAKPDRDGGVEVGAADRPGDDDADEDREGPRRRDDDPAGVLGLRLGEQDAGDDAVAEEDQEPGPEDLGDEDVGIPNHALHSLDGGWVFSPETLDAIGRARH